MNHKDEMKTILKDMLEEEFPSEQIQLWPAIQKRLAAGRQSKPQQGAKMKDTFGRKLLPAAFIVMALLLGALATPQGRAFAQGILQFFTRAEGQSLALPPGQLVSPEQETAPTAPAPAPLITISEAESQAGFRAAQLPSLPSGLEFLGARLYGNTISLEYAVPGNEGNLILLQSTQGYMQSDWDQVPAEAIQSVKVGDRAGEFVQGTFVILPGESSATWNSSAPILRLRWMRDGIFYQLTSFGDKGALAGIDQTALLALAESLEYPAP